jgi:hypothetical protein
MAEEKGKQAAGERQDRRPWTLREFGGKPLWDWLDLLIVPAALLLIGGVFTVAQGVWQQAMEDARAQQAQKIENQRAQAERELAEQRAQDEALQAYLSQVGNLLLEKDLRNSEEDSEVRSLARARTLTVLRSLDQSRQRQAIQFLSEAELVTSEDGGEPIIVLNGADLSGANLEGADLTKADLSDAEGWYEEQLTAAATLQRATMPNGQKYEDWLKDKEGRKEDGKNE